MKKVEVILLFIPLLLFAKPEAKVSKKVYDFGKIVEGPRYYHTFYIKNIGKDTLVIESVSSSCGCTAALLSDKRIAPGDSAKLEVSFDSRGYAGVKINKQIYVFTNDPKHHRIKFTITGEVYKGPTARGYVIPITLNLGPIKAGESVEKTVTIVSNGDAPLVIDRVTGTPYIEIPGFSSDTLNPGDSLKVRIKVTPEKIGEYEGVVIFRTNDPQINYKMVRLVGKVVK